MAKRLALPRFVVLKSNHNDKYLRYLNEDDALAFLQASGEEIASPLAKFAIQMAKSGNGLVHLRCCYNNNKYWARQNANNKWIFGKADEPEEDQSKWSCTLFKPIVDRNTKTIQFQHVQLGLYSRIYTDTNHVRCLCADIETTPETTSFTFTDWESILILPKYVAFKGDNGKYLSAFWTENHEYLQFNSDDSVELYSILIGILQLIFNI